MDCRRVVETITHWEEHSKVTIKYWVIQARNGFWFHKTEVILHYYHVKTYWLWTSPSWQRICCIWGTEEGKKYAQAGVSLDSFKWMFNTQPPRTRTAVVEKREKIHLRWINKQFPCEWTLADPETFMRIKSNTVDKKTPMSFLIRPWHALSLRNLLLMQTTLGFHRGLDRACASITVWDGNRIEFNDSGALTIPLAIPLVLLRKLQPPPPHK